MSRSVERKVLWAEMRRPELEQALRERAVVLVPVGAIEQHGRHLPVDTDAHSVTEIAVRVARSLKAPRVLVAPTVAYGLSPHHMGFVGTITLRFDTLLSLLCDICRSIHAHGFRKVVLLNGHGGNTALVNGVVSRLSEEKIYVAGMTYWGPIASELNEIASGPLGSMSHACELETSLQLHLRPHLVAMSEAFAAPFQPLTSFHSRDLRAPGTVAYALDIERDAVDGVRGDPTLASANTGQRVIEAAVAKISQFVREFSAVPER